MSRSGSASSLRRFALVTALSALGVAGTAALGFWQLSRAAQKTALQEAMVRQESLPALDDRDLPALDNGTPLPPALLHRRIGLQGRWLPRYTIYLDNRQMDGRPGFYVLTPLQLDAGNAVLVQRGWIARDFENRTRLQPVETPAGPVRVEGRIEVGPARLYEFAAQSGDAAAGSSAIRQNLDLVAFRRETALPLHGFSVVQDGGPGEGLQRRWPKAASGVERHYGYAFQWFALSALIAFLYVWFQFIRRDAAARRNALP